MLNRNGCDASPVLKQLFQQSGMCHIYDNSGIEPFGIFNKKKEQAYFDECSDCHTTGGESMQWNFYLSGILYGRFYEEEQEVFVSRRDPMSGRWLLKEPMSEEADEYFLQLCKRSLWEFFRNKKEYEEMIEKGAEHGVTASGEEFTRRRTEAYIQRNCKAAKDLFYENGKIYALLMSAREYTAVLVQDGCEEKTVLSKWKEMYPEEIANVSFAGTFCGYERWGKVGYRRVSAGKGRRKGREKDSCRACENALRKEKRSGNLLPLCPEGLCPGGAGYERE